MIYYKNADYNLIPHLIRSKGRYYDDNIYSFDIETTSLMYNPNTDTYELYDKSKPPKYYEPYEKYGYMYIWQFSLNDLVVYGRTWEEFTEFITVISRVYPGRKFIFVHNLAWEFQFIKPIFTDFEIFARTNHKVITARSEKYNLEFRCSLMLANMKLELLPQNYNLPVRKQTGLLNYDKIRTTNTPLTADELKYCEYDCLVVYELIKKKRAQYKHIVNIPLTQTGELRRVCQKMYVNDYDFKSWLDKQLVTDIRVLQFCLRAFQGGFVHANACYANRVIYGVDSYDIASSYPTAQTAELYPVSIPFPVSPDYDIDKILFTTDRLFITEITFYNIESTTQTNIISTSKCYNQYHVVADNGRLRKAERITITLTSVDLFNVVRFYKYDRYEITQTYGFFVGYLDKKLINLIWDLYVDKTALKDIENQKDKYLQQKQYINACYGMSVTNLITDDVNYNPETGAWGEPIKLTAESAQDKLNKINSNRKTFLSQIWGIFITAYARRNLFNCIWEIEQRSFKTGFKCGVVYCDTDSIKCFGDVSDIFDRYNNEIDLKLKRTADALDLDFEKTRPRTKKGIQKPLGHFEYEGRYTGGFKTLGAKKYLYKLSNTITFNIKGRTKRFKMNVYTLHLTLSGVSPASGIKILNNLDEFKNGFNFGYEYTGKKLLYYNDEQPEEITVKDYNGVTGVLRGKSGICLTPCQYKLGITPEYFNYLNECENDMNTLHGLMEI